MFLVHTCMHLLVECINWLGKFLQFHIFEQGSK